jgi:hypothetical protein
MLSGVTGHEEIVASVRRVVGKTNVFETDAPREGFPATGRATRGSESGAPGPPRLTQLHRCLEELRGALREQEAKRKEALRESLLWEKDRHRPVIVGLVVSTWGSLCRAP